MGDTELLLKEFLEWCIEKRTEGKKWSNVKELGKGISSTVYQICDDKDCNYIAKAMYIPDEEIAYEREIRIQNKCSTILTFISPIYDAWICSNQLGIIITKFFPINLEEYILANTDHVGYIICVLYKIILHIYDLHSKAGVLHGDLHLKNIRLDENNIPYFIDFGLSVDFLNEEDVKMYKRIYHRLMNPDGTILFGYEYMEMIKIDYLNFLNLLDKFITLNAKHFNKKLYNILQLFLDTTNVLIKEKITNEIVKLKESSVVEGKRVEKEIIEFYKEFIPKMIEEW